MTATVLAGVDCATSDWSSISYSVLFLCHSPATAGGRESRWVRNVTAVQILSSEMSFPDESLPNCPSHTNIPSNALRL